MARRRRSDVFVADETAVVHVMNRTVRGLFLLGEEPVSRKNFDYRKEWMEQRLQLQASCFAIDLLGFSILSNHFHQVLRSRPDISESWSNEEVARRWLMLCPEKRDEKGIPFDPTDEDIANLCRQKKKIKEYRKRLTDISWWMRLFNQTIAQRANREDKKTGSFWQGRFKAVRLLDEASLLACMAYVDLNPVRAALAETLEESRFTSAWHRLQEIRGDQRDSCSESSIQASDPAERSRHVEEMCTGNRLSDPEHHKSDEPGAMLPYLAPVLLAPEEKDVAPCNRESQRRCSNKGFLPMTTAEYLNLLDWTARQPRQGAVGKTPSAFAALFERLQISTEVWLQLVRNFRRYFGAVAGKPAQVEAHVTATSKTRFRLPKATKELLTTHA
ncbi:MAG: hypothetical protein JNL58_02170 [Planctomyces sp.]|nr:hypothetical protein [Planctomyces sp.]